MSKKEKYNEFDLNSDEFENNEKFVVTISSDSDFDDVSVSEKRRKLQDTNFYSEKRRKSSSSLEDVSTDEDNFNSSNNSDKWHTISIVIPDTNQQLNNYMHRHRIQTVKTLVLDSILKNIEPFQFIPCLYSEYKNFHNFHIFDCEDAVKKLRSQNYKCTSKDIPEFSFDVKFSPTDYSMRKTNINYLVKTVLKKRINKEKKILDLKNFVGDKYIKNTFYMPLWYVGNQTMIASKMAKLLNPSLILELDLSSNSISDFEGFNMAVTFSNLKKLNLSYNRISHIKELVSFRGLNLRELSLEFNPICHNYILKNEYITAVKLIFPTIQVLDNNQVAKNALPRSYRNYSVNPDCAPIIDRFMLIYFSLFDSEERSSMMDLYTKTAIFSLNCAKTDNTFHKRSRNLLDSNSANIYAGQRSIIGCLCWIPPTEHIPLNFCVDVLYYSDQFLIVNISGMFVLTSSFHNLKNYNFMRTFTLVRDGIQYKISNEMLNIKEIPLSELPDDYQPGVKNRKWVNLTPSEELSKAAKYELTMLLTKLSKLTQSDAEICLQRASWNFRIATEFAIDKLKGKF